MSDDINRKPVEGMPDVYSVEYTQDLDEYTRLNSDVVKDQTLYYTDLDTSAKAELFLTPSEAKIKAEDMIRKFPNHVVKFYMFYYTEIYDNNELKGVKQQLCQVVPGTEDPDDANYRKVKRKNLKKIYDKIDFITIYRPLNGIKWYTVSKEELNKELAVIKEFYGLTNFPDKVGDFYFSKKIGKWLATSELSEILSGYEATGQKVPVIYIDEFEDGYIKARKKSVLELIWDFILGLFEGLGTFLKNFFGAIFDQDKWNAFLNSAFKDENGNLIPDNVENFWNNAFNGNNKVFDLSIFDNNNESNNFISAIKKFREKMREALKIGTGENDTNTLFSRIGQKSDEIYNSLHGEKSVWTSLWTDIVGKILQLLGIDIDTDRD